MKNIALLFFGSHLIYQIDIKQFSTFPVFVVRNMKCDKNVSVRSSTVNRWNSKSSIIKERGKREKQNCWPVNVWFKSISIYDQSNIWNIDWSNKSALQLISRTDGSQVNLTNDERMHLHMQLWIQQQNQENRKKLVENMRFSSILCNSNR